MAHRRTSLPTTAAALRTAKRVSQDFFHKRMRQGWQAVAKKHGRGQAADGWESHFAAKNETMVEAITFVGIHIQGVKSNPRVSAEW